MRSFRRPWWSRTRCSTVLGPLYTRIEIVLLTISTAAFWRRMPAVASSKACPPRELTPPDAGNQVPRLKPTSPGVSASQGSRALPFLPDRLLVSMLAKSRLVVAHIQGGMMLMAPSGCKSPDYLFDGGIENV
ncbi:hypothetical protein Efla_007565 [Eimeria flavescens]